METWESAYALDFFEILYGRCNDSHGDIFLLERANRVTHRFRAGEWRLAAAQVEASNPQYFKFNLQDGAQVGPNQVGGTGTVKTVVAFGLDVDAGKGLFHGRDHVLEKLNEMPVPPTAIINTRGDVGGFHAYWCLEQPYGITSELDRDFVQSAAKRWEDCLRELLDGKLDTTSDLGRMLRPPGSHRIDGDREPVELYIGDGALYSINDLVIGEPEPVAADPAPFTAYGGDTAGTDFMRSHDSPGVIAGIMESLGYRVWRDKDACYRFNRPGSESKMANGKFGDLSRNGSYQLVSFTPNAPFEVNRSITLFQAYCDLLHGGDHGAGAAALYETGFGDRGDLGDDVADFEMPDFVSRSVSSATAPDYVDETEVSPAAEEINFEPGKVAPMPLDLIEGSGWLEEATDWILSNMSVPLPELAFASALHLLSLACARKWRDTTPHQTCTNLYILCVAPTGSGKEMPRKCTKRFLEAAEYSELCGPDKLSSGPGLDMLLSRHPAVGVMLDEMGDLVQQICSDRAAEYMSSISQSLKILYTASSSGHFKGSCKVHDETDGIMYPHLSLIGSTTPAKFFSSMSADKITDGLIGRFTMMHADITREDVIEGHKRSLTATWHDVPSRLVESWRIAKGTDTLTSTGSVVPGTRVDDDGDQTAKENLEWREISRTAEAQERFSEHDLNIKLKNLEHDKESQTVEVSVWSRANEKTAKLALLFAVSRWMLDGRPIDSDPKIELEDMDRAVRMSNFLARRLITSIKSELHESEADADVVQFLKVLARKQKRTARPVRESDLYRVNPMAKLKGQKRDTALLELMRKQGYLSVEASERGGGVVYRITEDGLRKISGKD